MIKNGLIVFCVLALFILSANFANAQDSLETKPVKIAIIGDTEKFLPQMDLLTVKLSEDPNIQILERSDWDYLLRERTISASKIGQSSVKIGRLLGADALIILTEKIVGKKKVLFTKLVAVKSGVVLDSIASPIKSNKETFDLSSAIEIRFKPKIEKLNSETKKTVVSMLNIKAAVSTPELLSVEHDLNAAFAHRLMREQNLLVSERWNMAEADLENNLADAHSQKYATGSVLMEGTISDAGNDEIEVSLTFKKSDGKISKVTVKGKKDKIGKIVNELTDKCLKVTETIKDTKPWDIKKEAEEYLKEAIWAEGAGLYSKAAQSAESAWALGNRSKELVYLRIRSYAKAAMPYYLKSRGSDNVRFGTVYYKIEENGKYLDSAIVALDLYKHYVIKGREKPDKKFKGSSAPDFYYLGKTVLQKTTELLSAYYNRKHLPAFPDKQAVVKRLIVECLDFLLNGEEQSNLNFDFYFLFAMRYSKYFIRSDDELIKMYKRLLGHSCSEWTPVKYELRKDDITLFYNQENPPFCIDRSGRYSKEVSLKFIDRLADELAKSDNLQLQLDSLMIKYIFGKEVDSSPTRFYFKINPEYLPLIHKFYDNHKKAFWTHQVFPVSFKRDRNIKKVPQFPFYYYEENLQHRSFRTLCVHSKDFDVITPALTYKEKQKLYKILCKHLSKQQIYDAVKFSEFLQAIVPQNGVAELMPDKQIQIPGLDYTYKLCPYFFCMHNDKIYIPYIKRDPDLGPCCKEKVTISISLAIIDIKTQKAQVVDYQPFEGVIYAPNNIGGTIPVIHNGKLYFIDQHGLIYALNLNGGKVEVLDLKIRSFNSYMYILNGKIYAVLCSSNLPSGLPLPIKTPYPDSAMIEYDLKTQKQKFIFYSRRKPAQTPLDAHSNRIMNAIKLSDKYILLQTYKRPRYDFYVVNAESGDVKSLKDMPKGFLKEYIAYICKEPGWRTFVIFKHHSEPFVSRIIMFAKKTGNWGKYFFLKGVPCYNPRKYSWHQLDGWLAYYLLIHNRNIPYLLVDGRISYSSVGRTKDNSIYGLIGKEQLGKLPVYTLDNASRVIFNTEVGAFQIPRSADRPVLFYSMDTLKKKLNNPGVMTEPEIMASECALAQLKKVKYDGSPESFRKIQNILNDPAELGLKLPQIILLQTRFGLNQFKRINTFSFECYKTKPKLGSENIKKWMDYIKSESDSGNSFYKNLLGVLYVLDHQILKKDVEKGLALWKEAAASGSMLAALNIGDYLCSLNELTDEQRKDLIKYYTMAADRGSATAAYFIGSLYCGKALGKSYLTVQPDYEKAVKYYKMAIAQKYVKAFEALARMYVKGVGVKQDREKAISILKEACRINGSSFDFYQNGLLEEK